MSDPTDSNWQEYSKLVLGELDRLDHNDKELAVLIRIQTEEIHKLRTDLAVEKARRESSARINGAVAGFLTGIIPSIIKYFS